MAAAIDPYVLLKDAKKMLKGSFFSKADPEGAARKFEAAAKEFRKQGDSGRERFVEAMMGAGEAYDKTESHHSAAKSFEAAAQETEVDLKKPTDAAPIWASSAHQLRLASHPDKAALNLIRAGKCMGDSDMVVASDYFDQAFAVFEDEDRARFSNDAVKQIITYLLSKDEFDRALAALRRQMNLYLRALDTFEVYLYKNMLGTIILLFHLGRYAAAEEEMAKFRTQARFAESHEAEAADAFLVAFRQLSQEKLDEAKKNQLVVNIDNRLARLARGLKFSDTAKEQLEKLEQTADASAEPDMR